MDGVQLTDGAYTKGYFWTQPGTVGWTLNAPFVAITLDLGAVVPIAGVSCNMAAGAAEVTWPTCIFILTSDDGKAFRHEGDLVELDSAHGAPPPEGYCVRRYWTDTLAAAGRFVKLVVKTDGPYVFLDEVEVYRGSRARQPQSGKAVVDIADLNVTWHVQRRLRNDLAAVRSVVRGLPGNQRLERELSDIETAIPGMAFTRSQDFRTAFPINDLHKRIFAVQAAAWRTSLTNTALIIWQKNRWDMLSPTEQPLPGGAAVEVLMMRNEHRAAAFNISHCGAMPAALRLSITGLPGGPSPAFVTVHDAPFTDTKSGVPVMAALPMARRDGGNYLIEIDPGMTRQVWLTFHSRAVPAGEYRGAIVIDPGSHRVPVRLRVYPFTMPDQPTLHMGGWDYTDRDGIFDLTGENRPLLAQHLRERFVDTPWATAGVMPPGRYDQSGNMSEAPDAGNFERWIQRWPGARNYFIFLSAQSRFAGFEMGTPSFRKALADWITWWVKKAAEHGVRPEQIGLLLVDEPHTPEQDRVAVEYAGAIKSAQPGVRIWEDPTWTDPSQADPGLFRASDILCPNLPMWIEQGKPFAEFYIRQRDAGRDLWFYSCSGPGKLLDPYAYHLMQQWFCWKYNAKGSCFWAFCDSGGSSSWNEYGSVKGAYTPVFLDRNSVTPGKHMEAIREGVEDYEYLRMLRDRVAELERRNVPAHAIAGAKALLGSAADRVTGCMTNVKMIQWAEPKDRSIADRIRAEVLEALMQMRDPVNGGEAGFLRPTGLDAEEYAMSRKTIRTFSIVAADPEAGVCGAAVASKYPAVGKAVPHVRAGVGAFCTQYWGEPGLGAKALDLLGKGKLPEEVLGTLLAGDVHRDKRQLAIVDMQGRCANRNPDGADPEDRYWGMTGRNYACQGNTLAGRAVITDMAAAYEDTAGSFADRLVAALLAADRAGGDRRGRLAAGIRVAKKGVPGCWLELDADNSDHAVEELARKYSALDHEAKGRWSREELPRLLKPR
ncbi:MAG: DUF1028 domain-containing protein [Lentisphaerae bacterium]|nr:DUF1028 domain-containing protein [Lentisphaerota bacterium]